MIIRKRNQKGFTLIELMIVVGIIAILAVIAIPGYQQYVLRSYRVEARNALQEMASHWQKHYSVTRQWNKLGDGSTVTANTLPAQWGLANVPASGTARYQITVVELSETKYLLKATALGAQAKDRCGAFFLNQSGTKMATAGTGDAAPAGGRDPLSLECWSK